MTGRGVGNDAKQLHNLRDRLLGFYHSYPDKLSTLCSLLHFFTSSVRKRVSLPVSDLSLTIASDGGRWTIAARLDADSRHKALVCDQRAIQAILHIDTTLISFGRRRMSSEIIFWGGGAWSLWTDG